MKSAWKVVSESPLERILQLNSSLDAKLMFEIVGLEGKREDIKTKVTLLCPALKISEVLEGDPNYEVMQTLALNTIDENLASLRRELFPTKALNYQHEKEQLRDLAPGDLVRFAGGTDVFKVLQNRGERTFVQMRLIDTEVVTASLQLFSKKT